MNKKRKLTLVFILILLSRLYSYLHMKVGVENGELYLNGLTNYISVGLNLMALLIALWMSFSSSYNLKIFRKYPIALTCSFIAIVFWLGFDLFYVGIIETFYSSSSSLVYLTVFTMAIGCDEECWFFLKKLSPIMGSVFLFLTLFFYSILIIPLGGRVGGGTPVTYFLVSSFWWLALCSAFIKQYNKRTKIYIIVLIIVFGLIAFSLTYRSWMIQTALLILIIFYQLNNEKRNKNFKTVAYLTLIIVIVAVVFSLSDWTKAFSTLEQKSQSDTRLFQYKEAFSQIPLTTWLFGGGINVSYNFSAGSENYTSIDNQLLMAEMHYGCFLAVPFFFIWFAMFFNLFWNSVKQKKTFYPEMLILMLWLFALGGLSVFNAIAFNSQSILLAIVLGRCFYINQNINIQKHEKD